MAERPDLDAIRERLHKAKSTFPDRPYQARTFHQQVSDTAELLTYCRELEADNKKLQGTIAQIYDQVQRLAVDAWIKKWTFEGGAYDDAPPMPKT